MSKHVTAGRDRRTTVVVAAGLCAMALLLWLAVGQTRAAFTDTTENPGNEFTTGTIEITSSQPASALFNFDGMLPGHTRTATITISNGSTAPLGVRMYGAAYDPPDRAGSELADELNVFIEIVDTGGSPTGAVVFDGTMAEFAATTDWPCGWWTGHDPEECNPAPPPPPTSDEGPLESALRTVIPDDQEDQAPFDEDFWDAVRTADSQIESGARTVDGVTQGQAGRQPVAEAWALVPDDVKTAVSDADPDTYAAIEEQVENSPAVPAAPTLAPSPEPTPEPEEEKTYPELGDRLEELGEDGSQLTYEITVTLSADAGQADVEPDDSLGITFVWEGRA